MTLAEPSTEIASQAKDAQMVSYESEADQRLVMIRQIQ